MAGMTEQPSETKSGKLGDASDELRGTSIRWVDAAPVETDVDLDEDVDLAPSGAHGAGPPSRDLEIVDDERQACLVEEPEDAFRVHGVQWIREADVPDPGVREHFGLAKLRAADAHSAARDLHASELG